MSSKALIGILAAELAGSPFRPIASEPQLRPLIVGRVLLRP